ncbi:MAG: hypothetical protein DMD96_06025 [Candidatus Rokuibacteriota bacterium]|nr:MAG: hypothetical protein DMD96_06025 [Candidatus Rokubacteria bacterium]
MTVVIALDVSYELLEPVGATIPVEYAVAGPLKIPTSRARMRRPIVQIAERSDRPAPAAVAEAMRRVILPAVADLIVEAEGEALA